MSLLPALGLVLVAAGLLLRRLGAWFRRLEADSEFRPSDLAFEDPTSLAKAPAPSVFAEASKALTIVFPAYNEEARLPATLAETLTYLQARRDKRAHFTYEVIVVDDGSSDGTARVAAEFSRKHGFDAVRLLRLPANRGKGYAVRCGMLAARGALVLFADADGATSIFDVEKLEAALNKVAVKGPGDAIKPPEAAAPGARGALGMAVGSRAHLEAQAIAQRSGLRNFLMHGFHMLVLLVAGGAVRDTQCGFKLFTRRAAALLAANQRLQRWCFDVELLALAQRFGIPVAEVAVTWTEIPGSKVRFTSILHMAWELAAIVVGYRLTRVWTVRDEAELVKAHS